MSKVKLLHQDIISKISAGQVVERPASVVKELIENSLDAKSTSVSIELKNGGMDLIRVVDNGEGISKSNLSVAPLAHTTSKIDSVEDLDNIHTFGFRGEALFSISSMSELVIKSRTKSSSSGNQISVSKNKLSEVSPVGMQKGTIVEVNSLFQNVPARRKNLKSKAIETRAIVDSITAFAIAYPEINFELISDSRVVFSLPAQTQRERNQKLLGEFISEGLMPISYQDGSIRISGFIGIPQLAIKQNTRQYLYVNKRYIHNEEISTYIKSLYGNLIDPRLKPAYIIELNIPPDIYDININPRKETANFYAMESLMAAISNAIDPTLKKNNMRYGFNISPSMSKKTAFVIKDAVTKWSVKPEKIGESEVIQIDNTFLITQSASKLLIIDQHAGHERVLYEQFLEAFKNNKYSRNKIRAEKISLTLSEMKQLSDLKDVFSEIGFKFMIKKNIFYLTEVPAVFEDRNFSQLISEVLSDIKEYKTSLDTLTNQTISYLACRSAIKAGDELNSDESKRLIEKIFKTKTNYTCPHGRPVMIEIPLSQLHVAFRRK